MGTDRYQAVTDGTVHELTRTGTLLRVEAGSARDEVGKTWSRI